MQNSADWYKNAGNGEFILTDYEARPCELKDYAEGDNRQELYEVWNGFFTLCPEWDSKENGKLSLLGDPAAMVSKAILIDVRECEGPDYDPATGVGCAPDKKEWLRDIQADVWIVNKKMNFTDRIGEPSFMILDIYDSQVVDTYRSSNVVNVN